MTPQPMLLLLALQNQQRGPGFSVFMLQMLAFFAIIYFLLIRPKTQQEKRLRQRVAELRRGDEVVTAGGIIGEVVNLKEDRVTIRSGESRFVVLRDRVAEVRTKKESKS